MKRVLLLSISFAVLLAAFGIGVAQTQNHGARIRVFQEWRKPAETAAPSPAAQTTTTGSQTTVETTEDSTPCSGDDSDVFHSVDVCGEVQFPNAGSVHANSPIEFHGPMELLAGVGDRSSFAECAWSWILPLNGSFGQITVAEAIVRTTPSAVLSIGDPGGDPVDLPGIVAAAMTPLTENSSYPSAALVMQPRLAGEGEGEGESDPFGFLLTMDEYGWSYGYIALVADDSTGEIAMGNASGAGIAVTASGSIDLQVGEPAE